MSADVAHPLIVPLPRLVPPAARALRWAAVRQLRASWRGGRLDLELPSGELVRLGSDGARGTDGARSDGARGRGELANAELANTELEPGSADVRDGRSLERGGTPARVRVHDDRLFLRLVLRGELGGGESFVAGEWSSDDLVGAMRVFVRATAARGVESPLTRVGLLGSLTRHRRASNSQAGSERNVHAHYDLGNAFYRTFLDSDTLAYSCAIWQPGTATLADAQRAKLDRLCDWLELSPRDHLLEIGCGWGGMAIHAAATRGCRVTAITLSEQQLELARARVAGAGLADRVTIAFRDYRDLGSAGLPAFDKVVSIEMLEQVGYEYLPRFFDTCARVLAPRGRLAVQTITMPDERFDAYRRRVDWMQTYVFPGTVIPSLAAIRHACAPFALVRGDDIGPDYAPTLRVWRERFVATLPTVRALGFDTPFIRTWLLYLAFSEAAFAERTLGDYQLLFVR